MARFSPRPELQDFLSRQTASMIAKGSQSTIYGTNGMVIKSFPEPSWVERQNEKDGILGGYETHKLAKEVLGGLCLPFEMAEGVRVRVYGNSGLSTQQFDRAIVQTRIEQHDTLKGQLIETSENGDPERLNELLELFLEFRLRLLRNGAFLADSIPDNIAILDGEMLLRDIGGIKFSIKDQLLKVMGGKVTRFQVSWVTLTNYWMYIDRSGRRALGDRWKNFKKRFREFYLPENLSREFVPLSREERRLIVTTRSRANGSKRRVPNVQIPADIA